jgi:hypothetical protein
MGREYYTFEKDPYPGLATRALRRRSGGKSVQKRERFTFPKRSSDFVGTVSEAIEESPELFVSNVMSHFA